MQKPYINMKEVEEEVVKREKIKEGVQEQDRLGRRGFPGYQLAFCENKRMIDIVRLF